MTEDKDGWIIFEGPFYPVAPGKAYRAAFGIFGCGENIDGPICEGLSEEARVVPVAQYRAAAARVAALEAALADVLPYLDNHADINRDMTPNNAMSLANMVRAALGEMG